VSEFELKRSLVDTLSKLYVNHEGYYQDISKGTHQMHIFKNDAKKQHLFTETCLYGSVRSLPVMPSLLPHVFWWRSQAFIFFTSVV